MMDNSSGMSIEELEELYMNNNEDIIIERTSKKKGKKKKKTTEELLSGNNDLSEKEFKEIIKYQFRKISEVRDLPPRKYRVMYYLLLPDGTKIFKKPGYLLRIFEDRVMLGNLPDSDIKYHIKKNDCKCLNWTSFKFCIWWVRLRPEGCKTKWYREITLDESIKKYKSLKKKYKKLADKYLDKNNISDSSYNSYKSSKSRKKK